jgi:hypothetical protein
MSSLLEEAIVDAKALKEAALKNAETVVLEKYSAEVRTALDVLLEQDEGADSILADLEEDAPAADSTFTDGVPYGFQNEELGHPGEDEIVEINFNELRERLKDEIVEGDNMIDATALADEIALQEADDDDDDGDPDTQMQKDAAKIQTAQVGSQGSGEDVEDLDEDINLTEEMLSDLIEELVVDMQPVPNGWSSVNSAYNGVEQANNDAMAAAHGAHLEEAEELEEDEDTAPDVTHMVYENKITKLTESTKELRALLIESKNQLMRLNLENAKLVYQNKALSSTSLNERQKNQIVEAVQSANSVEEANMIFETIQNAVGVSNSRKSSRPQTLREAVTRPTSLLLNSKKNNEATKDPAMGRMLRLAGLQK